MCSSASGNAVRTAVITTTSGDRSIQATVTRKHVKNLNLRVHADGTVTMSIPMRTSIARAQAMAGFSPLVAFWWYLP